MPFKHILIALDGSKFSEYAAQFAFLLAQSLGASIAGEHVIDPRMADLFFEPEFASELGLAVSNETTDKVMGALYKMSDLLLKLFRQEAARHSVSVETFRDEGYVVYEILKRLATFDLLVVGHRGGRERSRPSELMIGSTAERLTLMAHKPVLIAASHPASINQILVAFDGSEPAIGALLMAEKLAKAMKKPLRATYITRSLESMAEAKYAVAQGEQYLKERWDEPVFSIDVGVPADLLLDQAAGTKSLLVLGAYGFRDPDQVVMGTTATHVLRRTENSVLIYR